MAKIKINERQYALLMNHAKTLNEMDSKSQAIVDDILGTLNEGDFNAILAKVKNYAQKGLITATVLTALLAAPQLTSAQKSQIKDIASAKANVPSQAGGQTASLNSPAPSTGSSTKQLGGPAVIPTAFPIATKDNVVSVQMQTDWNAYTDWLAAKGLKGSPKLNNIPFSKQMILQYKSENPSTTIDTGTVVQIQRAIRRYRDMLLYYFNNDPSKASPNDGVKPDKSNFMTWVTGTGDDNIAGEYTSQFKFPHKYMIELSGEKTDQGFAEKGGKLQPLQR